MAVVDGIGNDDIVSVRGQDTAADGLKFLLRRPAVIKQDDAFCFFPGCNNETGNPFETNFSFFNHLWLNPLYFFINPLRCANGSCQISDQTKPA